MLLKKKMIIFVCDSRDYHAMDWFHVVKDICTGYPVFIATDILEKGEELSLVRDDDKVVQLFDISSLLFKKQSSFADIWRNLMKLGTTPFQIRGLRRLAKENPDAVFHAHSMYYIFLCWLAGIRFIATPMGSDVLVRPDESKLYRYMTKKSLAAAYKITVDSEKLKDKVFDISNAASVVIQNGIDVAEISSYSSSATQRNQIISIRGFYPNYQIEKILLSRNAMPQPVPVTFIYPFYEESYREKMKNEFIEGDADLGRLVKEALYRLLWESALVISVPESDSSPRSVYEAIFCGCAVAVSDSPWIDSLPTCMRSRLIVADLDDNHWFEKALVQSASITVKRYEPTQEALNSFDQVASMRIVCREIYNLNV